MYSIIGSDGREYGPVSAAQLREWLREGRVGGATQVQSIGTSAWTTLHALPEFADVFQIVPPIPGGRFGRLPPVVKMFGWLNLAVGLFSLLRQAGTLLAMQAILQSGSVSHLFTPTFITFQIIGIAGVVLRVVSGIGLLRGREWARQMAVYYAVFAVLFGLYGLGQTALSLGRSGAAANWATSLTFVVATGYSVVLLAFNVATVVCLGRKSVRDALAGTPAAQ